MIDSFDKSRWDRVKKTYEDWWQDKLDRPLFSVRITDGNPGLPKPDGVIQSRFYGYDFSVPVETIIKHVDYQLGQSKYLGDSYPTYLPDFGAGVNAAFLGGRHLVRPETVWFEAETPQPIEKVSFRHHPDNVVYQRIVEFYRKADAYFGGSVVLAMTHLNNGIDIPARFFDGVDFCLALYDQPEEVERLVWENHQLFEEYLQNLSGLMSHNPGFTCWGNILASEPWFVMQSDFCALIGPEQFDRFVLPELRACFQKQPRHNAYHLDGREELVHLDKILDIAELQAVQWVVGADELPDREWMWLYKKIRDAGKKLWFHGPEENLEHLAETLGSLEGVYWQAAGSRADEDRLCRTMERFGVPVDGPR